MSPPETRRTSGDEKEPLPSQRQSLPSITEALSGNQQPLSISSLLSTSTPQQKVSQVSQSPTSPVARSYLDNIPKGPPNSFPYQTPSAYRPQDASDRTSRPMFSPAIGTTHSESRFPALNSYTSTNSYGSHHATHSSKIASSPTTYSRPGASPIQHNKAPSPTYDKIPRTSTSSSNIPFGYSVNTYQPSTSFPPSAPGVPSHRTPTSQHPSSWRSSGHDYERIEEIRKAISKESTPPKQAYGESVKRHLDIFDLESSLNEVSIFNRGLLQLGLLM